VVDDGGQDMVVICVKRLRESIGVESDIFDREKRWGYMSPFKQMSRNAGL